MVSRSWFRWHASILDAWDYLKGSYWLWPTCMTLASGGLAIGLVGLDRRVSKHWALGLPWIHDTGPDGVRATLAAIAGSMITVAGVVFSITIVALTLASSQFGPRILRNFLHDRGNQLVMGTFLSTFLYCLMVLAVVGGGSDARFVPYLATAVGLGLGITSLFVLIYFVHHATNSIQVATIIDDVARDIAAHLPRLFPERIGAPGDDVPDGAPPPRCRDGVAVVSETSGYLRVLDADALLELATRRDLILHLRLRPGDFVGASAPLADVGPSRRVDEAVRRAVRDAFTVGPARTPVQDVRFLIGQLVEMAVRALSPGLNDPETAIACIQRLGWAAGEIASHPDPAAARCDATGTVRIVADPVGFRDVLHACFDRIRHYGATSPDVVMALARALEAVGERAACGERRRIVLAQLEALREGFAASGTNRFDSSRVNDALDRAQLCLAIGTVTSNGTGK